MIIDDALLLCVACLLSAACSLVLVGDFDNGQIAAVVAVAVAVDGSSW